LKEVVITGTKRIDQTKIPVTVGQNLFDVDIAHVLGAVTSNTFVDYATAKIDYRGTLTLEVKEKEAVAYLYHGGLYAVTPQFELIPLSVMDSAVALPIIQGINLDSVELFQTIPDPALHKCIGLIERLAETHGGLYRNLSEVGSEPDGLHLIFEPGSVIVNIGWGEYDKKFSEIEKVLASNKNPGLDLDLRLADLAIVKTRVLNREVNNGI
jgi:hypothetical protein